MVFSGLLLSYTATAQKMYRLNLETELTLTGVGVGATAAGLAIGRRIPKLTTADLALQQRENIFFLDRPTTYWQSGNADRASTYLLKGATIAPVMLLLDKRVRHEVLVISLMYVETFALTNGLTQLSKNIVKRSRPYTYNPAVPLLQKQERDARRSFFSGHTSVTASSCFFAARIWADYHPDSHWKPVVWTVAATIPAITGFLRMQAGRHFLTDVAVGYAVGATIGCWVPKLHKREELAKKGLSFYGSPQTIGLKWQFSRQRDVLLPSSDSFSPI